MSQIDGDLNRFRIFVIQNKILIGPRDENAISLDCSLELPSLQSMSGEQWFHLFLAPQQNDHQVNDDHFHNCSVMIFV